MKKMNNIVFCENFAYVNDKNIRISKDKIVELFDNAYNDGCMNFKKEEYEICTNYTFETDKVETKVTIPSVLIIKNEKTISELDDVLLRVEKRKQYEQEKKERIKRQETINKIKKFVSIAVLATVGGFALVKAAPAIVEWDNKNFERELEESGAKEMQQNLEMQKNHRESMEHYYEDQKIEEQQRQQQIREFEEQVERINQEHTQKMIDDMEQYRDLDTMPGVTRIEESDVKVR